MNASQKFMEAMRHAESLLPVSPDFKHSYSHFFTAHAAPMEKIGKLPKGSRYGKMGECYSNATQLSWVHRKGLLYAEGYAINAKLGLPLLHGWCVDERTLEVIDPTWREGHDYYGIVFKRSWVHRMALASGHYGIIDNWMGKGAALRNKMMTGRISENTWRHPVTDLITKEPRK